MNTLYPILLQIYKAFYWVYSLFNAKARAWFKGQKEIDGKVEEYKNLQFEKTFLFHCSSLGEFEQARPLIEKIKNNYPSIGVFITFFSPSGYEIRKNYGVADGVSYFPFDSKYKSNKFVSSLRPDAAIFIKYEFWPNMLKNLKQHSISTFLVSGKFREDQLFFKGYGSFYRKLLFTFDAIFVQDIRSLELLQEVNYKPAIYTGDTRYDRVIEIAEKPKSLENINSWVSGKQAFIVGSAWPEDLEVVYALVDKFPSMPFIIAPHDLNPKFLESIKEQYPHDTIFYSEHDHLDAKKRILVIDQIGYLSSIYQFGKYAFIGGAFGKGLHNILEAAVYGLPIFFGNKNHQKFSEAMEMLEKGLAQTISSKEELLSCIEKLEEDGKVYHDLASRTKQFVMERGGSTKKIIDILLEKEILP